MPRYIQVGVGTPDNINNYVLANDATAENFIGSGVTVRTTTATNFDGCSIMSLSLNDTAIANNQSYIDGLDIQKKQLDQYSLFEGSKYKTLMTVDDQVYPTNKTFTEIPIGEKPTDWDEHYNVYYYIKHIGHPNNTVHDVYYTHPTSATWDATQQYYYSNNAYHYYYIGNGDTQVRIGGGDPGLSDDNYLPGYWLLTNGNSTTAQGDDGYWTGVNGDTVERLGVPSNPGSVQLRLKITSNTAVSGMSNLMQGGNSMSRYLFAATYNTGWKSGISDEKKGQWRTRVHNLVTIKNETITQFGFVNYDGKRYFGIWVSYPTMPRYIGFKKYASASVNPWTSNTGSADLRTYDYDQPFADNEAGVIDSMIFYGIEIEKMNVTIEVKEGQVPPNVNPNPPIGGEWKPIKPGPVGRSSLGTLSGSGEGGFHVWALDSTNFHGLLGNFWNWGSLTNTIAEQLEDQGYVENILSNIGNIGLSFLFNTASSWVKEGKIDPMSAVQTCMALPCFIYPQVQQEGDYGHVKVAGLEQSQQGYCCLSETYSTTLSIDCSGLFVTGSYLDLAPYSTAELYLPYIGFVGIDPADCFGGRIEVSYTVCVVDGTIAATVYAYGGLAPDNPTIYGPFVGNASFRIPLAQKDANAFQRDMGYLSAIGSGIYAAATKNIAELGTAAEKLKNSYLMPQQLHGGPLGTGSAIVSQTKRLYLIVNTPLPLYTDWSDSMLIGHSSGKVRPIKENSGFVSYSNAKLNKVTATAAEINDIQAILRGGVYQ